MDQVDLSEVDLKDGGYNLTKYAVKQDAVLYKWLAATRWLK